MNGKKAKFLRNLANVRNSVTTYVEKSFQRSYERTSIETDASGKQVVVSTKHPYNVYTRTLGNCPRLVYQNMKTQYKKQHLNNLPRASA